MVKAIAVVMNTVQDVREKVNTMLGDSPDTATATSEGSEKKD